MGRALAPYRRLPKNLVATSVAAALLLSACSAAKTATQTKKTGPLAILRVGAADATNSAGLNPLTASAGASLIVVRHVYDSLMVLEGDQYRLSLATSVQPNADGSVWTIRIHDGVFFHDGRPVRAADVAYSVRTLASPASNRASVYASVNVAAIKVLDPLTVQVPLKQPRGDFREAVLAVYSPIFPDGTTDFSTAIGSGPYKLDRSDQQTVRLTAVDRYWGGTPTVKVLEITRIADAATRLSALKDGQIDYAVGISPTGAQVERNDTSVVVRRGGVANSNALSFSMNQQLAPFNDPRVRRAVRLAADRPALVSNALLGFGTPGNDVVGEGLPGYAPGMAQRTQDLQTARQLFQAAGVTQLTLRAAEIVPGMLSAARLLAQQLAQVGVTLTINQEPAGTYYSDLKALSTHPFQAFYYTNRPAAVDLAAVTVQGAPFNVTGTGPDWWSRLAAAQALVDDAQRAKAFDALQQELYQTGGDLLWGFQESLDASRPGITGVLMSQSVPIFTYATSST